MYPNTDANSTPAGLNDAFLSTETEQPSLFLSLNWLNKSLPHVNLFYTDTGEAAHANL